jgi:hypothetical protein
MKPPLPQRFESVVALLQRVAVDTPESGPGTAIATAFDGDAMIYLVVFDSGRGAPRWVRESEISGTRVN